MEEVWEVQKTYKSEGLLKVVDWVLHITTAEGTASNAGKTLLKTALPLTSSLEEIVEVLKSSLAASSLDGIRSHSLSIIHEQEERAVLSNISEVHFVDSTLLELEVRQKRNQLLSETDWMVAVQFETQVVNPALTSYRQDLRDITSQVGFPLDVVWPVKP